MQDNTQHQAPSQAPGASDSARLAPVFDPVPGWADPIWWRNIESRRRDALAARNRMRDELGRSFI